MKTANKEYGKADFNYPEVELVPSYLVKKNAAKAKTETTNTDETNSSETGDSNEKPATTPAEAVQNYNKHQQNHSAPTPAAETKAPTPIPMATPEGLR